MSIVDNLYLWQSYHSVVKGESGDVSTYVDTKAELLTNDEHISTFYQQRAVNNAAFNTAGVLD